MYTHISFKLIYRDRNSFLMLEKSGNRSDLMSHISNILFHLRPGQRHRHDCGQATTSPPGHWLTGGNGSVWQPNTFVRASNSKAHRAKSSPGPQETGDPRTSVDADFGPEKIWEMIKNHIQLCTTKNYNNVSS